MSTRPSPPAADHRLGRANRDYLLPYVAVIQGELREARERDDVERTAALGEAAELLARAWLLISSQVPRRPERPVNHPTPRRRGSKATT